MITYRNTAASGPFTRIWEALAFFDLPKSPVPKSNENIRINLMILHKNLNHDKVALRWWCTIQKSHWDSSSRFVRPNEISARWWHRSEWGNSNHGAEGYDQEKIAEHCNKRWDTDVIQLLHFLYPLSQHIQSLQLDRCDDRTRIPKLELLELLCWVFFSKNWHGWIRTLR